MSPVLHHMGPSQIWRISVCICRKQNPTILQISPWNFKFQITRCCFRKRTETFRILLSLFPNAQERMCTFNHHCAQKNVSISRTHGGMCNIQHSCRGKAMQQQQLIRDGLEAANERVYVSMGEDITTVLGKSWLDRAKRLTERARKKLC